MEESADADYIVIIDSGKIAAEGGPLELKNKYSGDFVTVYGEDSSLLDTLGVKYERVPSGFRFSVPSTKDATKLIISHPELFSDYEITKSKMDDVFLAVTGKKLSE
jgi:multidrug/hemolysin transport system ATP-binding protein